MPPCGAQLPPHLGVATVIAAGSSAGGPGSALAPGTPLSGASGSLAAELSGRSRASSASANSLTSSARGGGGGGGGGSGGGGGGSGSIRTRSRAASRTSDAGEAAQLAAQLAAAAVSSDTPHDHFERTLFDDDDDGDDGDGDDDDGNGGGEAEAGREREGGGRAPGPGEERNRTGVAGSDAERGSSAGSRGAGDLQPSRLGLPSAWGEAMPGSEFAAPQATWPAGLGPGGSIAALSQPRRASNPPAPLLHSRATALAGAGHRPSGSSDVGLPRDAELEMSRARVAEETFGTR